MAKHFIQGMDVNAETLSSDVIAGDLQEDQTFAHFKELKAIVKRTEESCL